ncbi:hypothetical protein NL676_022288 [Syzygium grande]|nr:hypothetical protein NL676_022288 [Syzygium grande]
MCKTARNKAFPFTSFPSIRALPPTAQLKSRLQNTNLGDAHEGYDRVPTSGDVFSWNILLRDYVRNRPLHQARDLFDGMPLKDVVSWNTMLSGYYRARRPEDVYGCFGELGRCGVLPNSYTISMAISSFLDTRFKILVPQIHARIVCLGMVSDVVVGSALMKGYANVGDPLALKRVFDELSVKSASSWNALVSGYMEMGCVEEAKRFFHLMPESQKDVVSWTCLLSGYVRNRRIDEARSVFDRMSVRDVFSWTAMINGYVKNEKHEDALKLFVLMGGLVEEGAKFFNCMKTKYGIQPELEHYACMVDLFGKAGQLEKAKKLIEEMPMEPDVVVWGAFIGACTMHSSLEFGEFAEKGIRRLKEHHPAAYIMLLKIHESRTSSERYTKKLETISSESGAIVNCNMEDGDFDGVLPWYTALVSLNSLKIFSEGLEQGMPGKDVVTTKQGVRMLDKCLVARHSYQIRQEVWHGKKRRSPIVSTRRSSPS